MKTIFSFLMILFFASGLFANNEAATKDDIKIVLEQMDKRFEQMDKRLDFMQNLLYALMGLIFASPFVAIYLRDKKEAEDRKTLDNITGMLFVLREMAQNDEKLSKSLKAAGLL